MALPTPEVTELPEEVKRARDAAARRASLRATPTATAAPPTAPVASAAPEAAKAGGWFRRTANALRSGATAAGEVATAAPSKMAALPGQILNADLGAAAKGALRAGEGAAKTVGGALTGPMARAAAPIAAITSAAGSYGTDTDTYAQRTGIERGASDWTGKGADAGSRLRFDAVKDAGIRVLGTAQDLGNTLTFGLADRVGNALAGNGFNRSAGNQVGEVFGRGSEVGDNQPPATAAPAAPAAPTASAATPPAAAQANPRVQTDWGSRPGEAAAPTATPTNPNGVITRGPGNSYSGTANAKAGADMVDPQGAALDAATGMKSGARAGYGVSTIDGIGVEGHLRQLANIRALGGAGGAGEPVNAGAAGFGGGTLSSALRESHNRQSTAMSTNTVGQRSQRQQDALDMQKAQLAQARELAGAQLGVAQVGNANQLRVAEMNNATQRENNAATTRTALRGHELDYERGMLPLKMLQQKMATQQKYLDATKGPDGKGQADPAAAHAAMVRDGAGHAAEDLAKGVTTQLDQEKASGAIKAERAARTRALFNGRGGSLIDPNLKDDAKAGALKAAEDDAHSFARQTVKGFDNMREDEQQALMPQIMGLYELHQKTKNPDHTGNLAWARNLISPQDNSGPANSLREQGFYKGGKVGDRFGFLSGAFTGGYEKGDVDFNPSGGKNSLRIANPSDNALEVLRRLTQGKDPLGKD